MAAHAADTPLCSPQGRGRIQQYVRVSEMSVNTTNHTPLFAGFFQGLRAFGAKVGKAMITNRSMDARMARIEELQSKSDDELLKMGLRRDQIAPFVFRDLFYA